MRTSIALAVAVVGLWPGCQALLFSEEIAATQGEGPPLGNSTLSGVTFALGGRRGEVEAEAEGPEDATLSQHTLDKIRRHAGLYVNKWFHPQHQNTILVTAANIAYLDMLKNWRCHADALGLDYLIIAFDPELLKAIDGEHAVLVHGLDGHYYPRHAKFRQGHFNEMSCLKVRMVQQLVRLTGLNVVFSDPDNVLLKDPFRSSVSLGSKMLSGKYDYIYQQNHGVVPTPDDIGAEVQEGNTGFYFISGSRKKRKGVQALLEAALTECRSNRDLDDQTNFWQALRNVRGGPGREKYGTDNFACADLCGKGKTCQAPDEEVLSYCEMDPFSHATGWELSALPHQQQTEVATYHSNMCGLEGGMDKKIEKLARNGFWHDECAGQWSMVARQHSGGRKIPLQHVRYEGRDGQED